MLKLVPKNLQYNGILTNNGFIGGSDNPYGDVVTWFNQRIQFSNNGNPIYGWKVTTPKPIHICSALEEE